MINSAVKLIKVRGLLIIWLLIVFGVAPGPTFAQTATAGQASQSNHIRLADPTIFYHDGTYYLYGTVEGRSGEGFEVYTSSDLKLWEGPKGAQDGFALKKGDAFGSKGFWAPQVFYDEGRFYMAYTANENIAIAVSDSPLGPFTQSVKEPLAASVKRQIDPFIYIDENGKKYLYHVRVTEGNKIFVAEMTDDFSGIKQETLRECISAQEPWERTADAEWPITEGPTVLKHNNIYYLAYSANDFRNPDYAVGYATSTSPLGPWQKQKNSPILSKKDIGINGTEHGDFFKGKGNALYYVFHTHNSNAEVGPRLTALVKARFTRNGTSKRDKLMMDEKSFYYLKLKAEE